MVATLSYALGEDADPRVYRWGRGTDVTVAGVDFGTPELRTSDAVRPREDGLVMGRDYLSGMTITFDLNIVTGVLGSTSVRGSSALPALDALTTAWRADHIRRVPGAVLPLRMARDDGRSRRVYGRPRRIQPVYGSTLRGLAPVTCDFATVDPLFYADVESVVGIGFVPDGVGGFVMPAGGFVPPLVMSGAGVGTTGIAVGGTEPAWLATRIDGPISRPTVEVTDQWSYTLDVSLGPDQWVVVDPSPWQRLVRRGDGANLSGSFTAASRWLTQMRVPPGRHQVVLRGTDPTATSSVTCFWRPAWATP